ncbi:hypothetical protein PRK78_005289 [Emydomyces testavorans]|uniref:Ribosomal protein S21 n=1 Tax=Emydomyces testavorans TaxID=2070801 RepID=A0AAF0DK86_9EURO|nr:hypothetical protein PRK78_005289 [Emydomyces testavorans]
MEARHLVNGLMARSTLKAFRLQTRRPSASALRSYTQQMRPQRLGINAFTSKTSTAIAPLKRTLTTNAPSSATTDTTKAPSEQSNDTKDPNPPQKLNEVVSILHTISHDTPPPRRPKPAANPPPGSSRDAPIDHDWTRDLLSSLNMFDRSSAITSDAASRRKHNDVKLHLSPSLGRTVVVDHVNGFDVARALGMMESRCAANRVRLDEREQRFHVRRGQRKKDLRSKRWRKLFKFSFVATVARCEKLRRQGW